MNKKKIAHKLTFQKIQGIDFALKQIELVVHTYIYIYVYICDFRSTLWQIQPNNHSYNTVNDEQQTSFKQGTITFFQDIPKESPWTK